MDVWLYTLLEIERLDKPLEDFSDELNYLNGVQYLDGKIS